MRFSFSAFALLAAAAAAAVGAAAPRLRARPEVAGAADAEIFTCEITEDCLSREWCRSQLTGGCATLGEAYSGQCIQCSSTKYTAPEGCGCDDAEGSRAAA